MCKKRNYASKQNKKPCNVYFVLKRLQTSDTFHAKNPYNTEIESYIPHTTDETRRVQTKLKKRHARKTRIHVRNVFFVLQKSGDVEANEKSIHISLVAKAFAQTSYIYLPANPRFIEASAAIMSSNRAYQNHDKTCFKYTGLFPFSLLSRMRGTPIPRAHVSVLGLQ